MQIAIDRGNTQTKVSTQQDGKLTDFRVISDDGLDKELADYIHQHQPKQCIISDVRSEEASQNLLQIIGLPCIVMSHNLHLPFSISYQTPETLGHDRLANAAGAIRRYGDPEILVIDCGTCITYTFVERLVLRGGSIAPGIHMRFQALHEHTGRLPIVEFVESWQPTFMGSTTQESIHTGVVQGILAETDGMIELYRSQFPQIIVIVTGGDASFFEKHLKSSIFAAPQLTQEGLHEILRLNCA
jgi:type III pantothenate kinase